LWVPVEAAKDESEHLFIENADVLVHVFVELICEAEGELRNWKLENWGRECSVSMEIAKENVFK
jgi:hypothetical protein